MESRPIVIEIFTIPQAACDTGKANWQQVVQMVNRQIEMKFGETVDVRHIEFMTGEWFNHAIAQQLLEKGELNFPFVLVNGVLACADKKINISKINKAINVLIKEQQE